MRSSPLLVLLVLVLPALLPSLAATSAASPLLVYAGDSKAVGATLTAVAKVSGGVAPYTYAWSHEGSGARFADATAGTTTFDATGLEGAFVIALSVTDAEGATVADAVQHFAAPASGNNLLTRSLSFNFGLPEEILVEGAPVDAKVAFFDVPEGAGTLEATLRWSAPNFNDLDLELLRPDGSSADRDQGRSANHPERIVVPGEPAGRWSVRISPFLSTPTDAVVWVNASGGSGGSGPAAPPMPDMVGEIAPSYGVTDDQQLRGHIFRGTAPFQFLWDVQSDGVFDLTGQFANATNPVGAHAVRVRMIDGLGFRMQKDYAYEVVDVDTVVRTNCGGAPFVPTWAMEYSASRNTCWIHGGHHTYFMGDRVFAIHRVWGEAFSVEQQYAPPLALAEDPLRTPVHLEVSMDGAAWTEIGRAAYRFPPLINGGELPFPGRQDLRFDFRFSEPVPFRFIRMHNPLSATQGISGYLDHSALFIEADLVGVVPAPPTAPATRELSCETDILEDFFPEHPCWFGGVDRYDSPSLFHTYFLGEGARLSRIEGSVTVAPFRHDDWFRNDDTEEVDNRALSGNVSRILETNATAVAENATFCDVHVQVSVDGVAWRDAATVSAPYGVPTAFDVALDDEAARFVRYFPCDHARFDHTASQAPLHHPKGYFLESAARVTGELPA